MKMIDLTASSATILIDTSEREYGGLLQTGRKREPGPSG